MAVGAAAVPPNFDLTFSLIRPLIYSRDTDKRSAHMIVSYIIYAYFILGFVLIIAAPVWKIFKKAGRSGWQALIPGYNILEFGKANNVSLFLTVVPYVSIVFMIVLPFVVGVVQPQANFLFVVQTVLMVLFSVGVLSIFFFYPFLSLGMFVMLIYLHPHIAPELFVLKLIFIAVSILELATELWYWIAALKKMQRPLWQLVFPLLPLVPIISIYLITEFAVQVQFSGSVVLGLAVFLTMLAALAYLYYLGYSLKIKYAEE
jgi:hypothetical protein